MTAAPFQPPTDAAAGDPAPPAFELRGVSKRFGDVLALDGVDLALAPGEIHALLGENGAGKSTAVKLLNGMLEPSAGELRARGEPLRLRSPAEARARGIGTVFQHFAQFDALSALENVAAAMPRGLSLAAVRERLLAASGRHGLPLHLDRPVGLMSAGERQRVEILRCLLGEPSLIIMDEPTSVLTPDEADGLARTLRRLAAEGRAVLYITHRLVEVRALCDRVTVLRGGRVVARLGANAAPAELADAMVGTGLPAPEGARSVPADARIRLRATGLRTRRSALNPVALRDVSLRVRAGEILGIAGVAGNGQSELFAALSGEAPLAAGTVEIDGAAAATGINARRRRNAAFLPEDRSAHGGVSALPLSGNVLLSRHATRENFVSRGFVRGAALAAAARAIRAAFDVRAPAGDPNAALLSGGNLQKFLVGRELSREPTLLIVDQPSWGVDVRAAAAIRAAIRARAAAGAAIVLISQDLDEIFEVADTIAVLHDGELSAPMPAALATRGSVGLLMAGGSLHPATAPSAVAESSDAYAA